jgi:hypothetical protein
MTGGKGRSIIRLVLLASALSLQIRWPVSRGSKPVLTDPFRQMGAGLKAPPGRPGHGAARRPRPGVLKIFKFQEARFEYKWNVLPL